MIAPMEAQGGIGAVQRHLTRRTHGPIHFEGELRHKLVLLPYDIEGESGVYAESAAVILAALRENGIDAVYLHERDNILVRAGIFGVPAHDFLIGISEAVTGAAAWAALASAFKALFRSSKPLKVSVLVQRKDEAKRSEHIWFEYDGPADQFPSSLQAIGALCDGQSTGEPTDRSG